MRTDSQHLFSWLLHRHLRVELKKWGLTEIEFELLVFIKFIYSRSSRPCYAKDIHTMLLGMRWKSYKTASGLVSKGYAIDNRSPRKWSGMPRMELSLSPLGNELLEKIRLASESRIACIKHQLDSENSERSKVNSLSKRVKKAL